VSISEPDPDASREATPLLRVAGLSAFYGELQALHAIDLDLFAGDTLAIIGANGAGKSTLFRSISGLMTIGGTTRLEGEVLFSGRRIDRGSPSSIVEGGVALVPEGRRLFARMSVEDNLLCGAYLPRCRPQMRTRLAEIYDLFPRLKERRRQVVSQMSGGEQQMVAIGRALMSSPRLLLLDELSLGLSPAILDDIYGNLAAIVGRGLTVVLVEQELNRALAAANSFVVMLEGRIVLRGRPGEVDESAITAAYFGISRSSEQSTAAGGAE
jgi:branched-chain amino acid transport system ATP-binding protein